MGREIRTRFRDPEIGTGREDVTLVPGFPNSGGMACPWGALALLCRARVAARPL